MKKELVAGEPKLWRQPPHVGENIEKRCETTQKFFMCILCAGEHLRYRIFIYGVIKMSLISIK